MREDEGGMGRLRGGISEGVGRRGRWVKGMAKIGCKKRNEL